MGIRARAAGAALLVVATLGSASAERQLMVASAAWASLTPDQREVIELVAKDVWSEGETYGVRYEDLSERRKTPIRREAMDRLGFTPQTPRGVEA
ncbi:hypothetical protein [Parvularcula maris]|uniref:DUF4148 domain-containing protein n=1 Tax=Parvularcula maris TaxID=2965077 RepID=A0A9X2L9P1_9PROT|nr:hypothetical protein [Parvularcula maris]MCQ8185659.1 hypothetical protein [Parvularcula maris]